MPLVVDEMLEVGRIEVVDKDDATTTVDVNVVAHVHGAGELAFAKRIVADIRACYAKGTPLHIRARVYLAEFNSLVLLLSESGWRKWVEGLNGDAPKNGRLRELYTARLLDAYKGSVCEHAACDDLGRRHCTHEVCMADGNSVYWAGA